MESGIYRGTVRHRRFAPTGHAFQYRVFMMYLDLAELEQVFRGSWLWSARRPAPARFRREDFLPGHPDLATAVRDRVEQVTGQRPSGPVRMLANLRYFGYLINPITCYYCFDTDGRALTHVVAEVTNTPWGERTSYVLACDPDARWQRTAFDKEMHVSPFLPMDLRYHWHSNVPGDNLRIHLEDFRGADKIFDATLKLQREEISVGSLRRILLAYPFMTARVCAAIYWQAARLYFGKRVPFYSHPETDLPRSKA